MGDTVAAFGPAAAVFIGVLSAAVAVLWKEHLRHDAVRDAIMDRQSALIEKLAVRRTTEKRSTDEND